MGIRKAKDALAKAKTEQPANRKLHRKLKAAVSAKRERKPSFPGQHRGY